MSWQIPPIPEDLMDSLAESQLGISFTEEERRFIKSIKKCGVCVNMTKEAKEDTEFQRLTNLLSDLHKDGIIPSFQIVQA